MENVEFKLRKIKEHLLINIVESTIPSICQFYKDNDKGRIRPFATGILLSVGGESFLISAAHVLDEVDKIFIILKEEELHIGGTLIRSKIPVGKTRDDDIIDIGVIKLCPKSDQMLKADFQFLNENIVEYNPGFKEKDQFLIIGYPGGCKQTEVSYYKRSITHKPFLFNTELIAFPKKCVFDPKFNLLLNFHRKKIEKTDGGISIGPRPNGISGGGAFHLKTPYPAGMNDVSLSGIMHEYKNSIFHKYMVATSIELPFSVIEHAFGIAINKPTRFDKSFVNQNFN